MNPADSLLPPALRLLIRLHARAFFRRLIRKANGVKGVIMTVVGAILLVLWFGSALLSMVGGRKGFASASAETVAAVVQTMPVVMLGVCLLSLLLSPGGKGIAFTPAETDHLFPAPFTRRQLLLYRLARQMMGALIGAIFFGVGMRRLAISWAGTYVAAVLLLIFLFVFSTTVSLAFQLIAEKVSASRFRIAVITLAAAAGGIALWFAPVPDADPERARDQLRAFVDTATRLRDSPVTQTLALPFKPFAYALTAARWSDLLLWTAASASVVLATLMLALRLDADFLEASAANAAKTHAIVTRARKAGGVYVVPGGNRWRIPLIAGFGPAGAVAWRQAVTALRSIRGVMILLLCGCLGIAPLMVVKGLKDPTPALLPLLAIVTFMGTALFRFDFRADVDRLDQLKSLPASPLALTLGQLATPVLLLTFFQSAILLTIAFFRPDRAPYALAGLAFAPLVSLTLAAVENLAFLLFPHRGTPTPGDLTALARNALITLAKFALLALAAAAAVGGFFGIRALTASPPLALLTAWLLTAAIILSTLPLVAKAFTAHDPASDTAPAA